MPIIYIIFKPIFVTNISFLLIVFTDFYTFFFHFLVISNKNML